MNSYNAPLPNNKLYLDPLYRWFFSQSPTKFLYTTRDPVKLSDARTISLPWSSHKSKQTKHHSFHSCVDIFHRVVMGNETSRVNKNGTYFENGLIEWNLGLVVEWIDLTVIWRNNLVICFEEEQGTGQQNAIGLILTFPENILLCPSLGLWANPSELVKHSTRAEIYAKNRGIKWIISSRRCRRMAYKIVYTISKHSNIRDDFSFWNARDDWLVWKLDIIHIITDTSATLKSKD